MPKTINISDARKSLPSLFERVTARSGEMVVIRRRDGVREAVLVSREYVDSLLAANRRLAPATDFRLLGSGEAFADIDEALGDIRADDRKEAETRRSEVAPRRRGR